MNQNIKNILENITSLPGIYKFEDKHSNIIYIGKALNLKKRVTSYFSKSAMSVKTSKFCLLYTSPSPRDGLLSRMPSSA